MNNTKKVFEQSRLEANNNLETSDWRELIDEIGGKINSMKSDLESIKTFEQESASSTGSIQGLPEASAPKPSEKSSESGEEIINQEEINELKKRIEELEQKDKIKFIY